MRMTYLNAERELTEFVEKASEEMGDDGKIRTYTLTGKIIPGCLFGVRWGLGKDCLLVFKLSEDFEPVVYQQVIRTPDNKEPVL